MADAANIVDKPELSAKDEVRALLDRLADDVTLGDTRPGIPHEEVFRRFEDKWRAAGLRQSEGFTEEDCDRRFGKRLIE